MYRNTTPADIHVSEYNRRHSTTTPQRSSTSYDSPMLSPSPLRQRPLFPINTNTHNLSHNDDLPLCNSISPTLPRFHNPFLASRPQPITADEEDGSIFLSSTSGPTSFSPYFPTSTSQPLLTPVKQTHRTFTRATVPAKSSGALFATMPPAAPPTDLSSNARIGGGTKRKSTPQATPLRTNTLTPLKITQSRNTDPIAFECLAPLSAPKFVDRTPSTKAETEAYLKRQTASLTRLRLSDHNFPALHDDSEFDFGPPNDSGCEMDEDDQGDQLFLDKPRSTANDGHKPRSLLFHPSVSKGKEKQEVAECVSPGGHVTKRRARSRPLSAELREQAFKVPKSPVRQSGIPCRVGGNRPRHSGPIVFPSTVHRGRHSPASASSSSDAGSPRPRRRISGESSFIHPQPVNQPFYPPRPPLSRIESVSAATLFFGPAIPVAQQTKPDTRLRTGSSGLSSSGPPACAVPRTHTTLRPNLANRHSYAGPETGPNDFLWNSLQTRNTSPSPGSSPFTVPDGNSRNNSMEVDEDEDAFFGGDGVSFAMDVTRASPSPKPKSKVPLPMKFKPRETGLISDEEEMPSTGSGSRGDFVMPKASTSVSSICSDEGLVTPGVTPESPSGWPNARVFVNGNDTHPYSNEGLDVDEFIMKTLAAASKGSGMPKKAPGTPVKKVRMSYFGNDRPWQSAVASKIAQPDAFQVAKKAPRKSMPAAFPAAETGVGRARSNTAKSNGERVNFNSTDTDEDEEYSPSTRRSAYKGLGMGQPPPASSKGGMPPLSRNRWLMRRSSSGAFSSGSDSTSLASTPTRTKGIDWQLPKPRMPLRLSPSSDSLYKASPRSASGSSTSSITTLNSPTNGKRAVVAPVANVHRRRSLTTRRLSGSFEEEQPGRFDRDFEEIEEVGSGEFGKVIKVRSKTGDANEMFAIKKSKRFEGTKHRLRLREEIDILKHLSEAALTQYVNGRHPNVLGYIDSWEEDEALYIQTELCEMGNLGRFLWEYGRVFPRLEEARVWKIIADLSNGLRFIHDSGVIHLDLKPSNVFVTKEGRLKIGDFGMASVWPRPERGSDMTKASASGGGGCSSSAEGSASGGGFEREGDKLYLAPEVLQGRYGKAADVFSFGMTILETASNIVVPDQGEAWHRLRQEDFSQVDLEDESPELVGLLRRMMRTDPGARITMGEVCSDRVVRRAREEMEVLRSRLVREGKSTWDASPMGRIEEGWLERIFS